MFMKYLTAALALAALAGCTPDRSLDTGTSYWQGEYRDGYNPDYVSTLTQPWQPLGPN
jgi:hypothetical protein